MTRSIYRDAFMTARFGKKKLADRLIDAAQQWVDGTGRGKNNFCHYRFDHGKYRCLIWDGHSYHGYSYVELKVKKPWHCKILSIRRGWCDKTEVHEFYPGLVEDMKGLVLALEESGEAARLSYVARLEQMKKW